MTDKEFDTLDELYFLQSYRTLQEQLKYSDYELMNILNQLLKKGWLRCYINPDDEIHYEESRYLKEYRNYYYLASKEGLLAHNSNF